MRLTLPQASASDRQCVAVTHKTLACFFHPHVLAVLLTAALVCYLPAYDSTAPPELIGGSLASAWALHCPAL